MSLFFNVNKKKKKQSSFIDDLIKPLAFSHEVELKINGN